MPDPYRIPPSSRSTRLDERSGGKGLLRPALWLVLILSAAANGIASAAGWHTLVGVGFGLATLACVAVLIVHHYRHRR